jgi:hypothetical protein
MRLSELQKHLARLAGEAMNRSDEDPEVWMFDIYGGKREVAAARLDFTPTTMAEAEADIRHPIIDLMPPELS